MTDLVTHLVRPIVAHPDSVSVQAIEGDASVILELIVHDDDRDVVIGDDGRTLRAIRTVVSAAAGNRKATVELVGEHSSGAEE
jgi:predicted RNA-binding protein YlqC (UPF0109 family)